MIKKLSCVNISSKDPKALAQFYQQIGIPVYVEDGDYDGWHLGNPENEGSICVWDENKWGKSSGGYITMVFDVDDIQATYTDIQSQGIAIDPPRRADWGGMELILHDPDGNVIMFL